MDVRDVVVRAKRDYGNVLDSVGVDDFNQFTRKELEIFLELFEGLKLNNIGMEIRNLIKQKKVEEFPELLGVRHYPIIKEMEILSEDEKVKLDKHLAMLKYGNYVFSLYRSGYPYTKEMIVIDWLMERGVIEKCSALLCPGCGGDAVTGYMNKEDENKLVHALKMYKEERTEVEGFELYEGYCNECGEDIEVDEINLNNLRYSYRYKLIMERDTSLDNV